MAAVVLAVAGKPVAPNAQTMAVAARAAVTANRFERIRTPLDMVRPPCRLSWRFVKTQRQAVTAFRRRAQRLTPGARLGRADRYALENGVD
jgi:hypothetical protein